MNNHINALDKVKPNHRNSLISSMLNLAQVLTKMNCAQISKISIKYLYLKTKLNLKSQFPESTRPMRKLIKKIKMKDSYSMFIIELPQMSSFRKYNNSYAKHKQLIKNSKLMKRPSSRSLLIRFKCNCIHHLINRASMENQLLLILAYSKWDVKCLKTMIKLLCITILRDPLCQKVNKHQTTLY